uniref:Protein kinase domain-containing protein n=1 Tax=Echeneis naucrates TaxID=173247 RepID=A0A665TWH9_ECHNA
MSQKASNPAAPRNENEKRGPAPLQIKKMDILKNGTACYMVLDFKGEGVFGKVAKCLNLCTRETVAVKIHKKSDDRVNQREVTMLEAIRDLEPDKKNIVRFIDHFRFNDFSCLAFEMLDMSLWDIMKERKVNPLTLSEIRPVTQQLFVAFDALKSKGIMHTDLKPDNVMLVAHNEKPFKIKLIDFGLARPVSEVKLGSVLQPCPYRSPEVYLGLPLSEAVDMWAVGCLMAHMYFGLSLFPGNCPYNWMKAMVHLLGQPEDQQLNAGQNTWKFFNSQKGKGWRLHTPGEYLQINRVKPIISPRYFDTVSSVNYYGH